MAYNPSGYNPQYQQQGYGQPPQGYGQQPYQPPYGQQQVKFYEKKISQL